MTSCRPVHSISPSPRSATSICCCSWNVRAIPARSNMYIDRSCIRCTCSWVNMTLDLLCYTIAMRMAVTDAVLYRVIVGNNIYFFGCIMNLFDDAGILGTNHQADDFILVGLTNEALTGLAAALHDD